MSDFYNDMQNIATDLITEFKQGVIQYVDVTAGGGPPDNPGTPTEVFHTVDAVARGVSFKYVDGTSIFSTDEQITISGDQVFTPNGDGFVMVDTIRYKVVKIVRKPAAGTAVAYTIIYRK